MKDQFKINPMGSDVSSLKKRKSRISKLWFISFFACTATLSLGMIFVFWYTSVLQDAILSCLEIKNGTQTFAWWEKPPVKPVIRVRIWNYTNVEEYQKGMAEKLLVEEVGPYIYRETLTRVNVKLNDDGTVTYQENTTHEWEGGRPDNELIHVPNVPMIAAIQRSKEYALLLQYGLAATLNVAGEKPFKLLTVKEYLWGYTNNLVDLGITVMSFTESIPYNKFGMLMARNGLNKDLLTIHTGSGDINKVGLIKSINGRKSRDVWNDKECDKVEGTDGSIFPPNLIQDRSKPLAVYTRDMCRKFVMKFHGFSSAWDIPSLRYKPPKDIFTSSNDTNSCFCEKSSDGNIEEIKSCSPAGVFDLSRCIYGVPLLASFPHFYQGDEALLDHVDGLNPQEELHETYADIHPRIGVLMGGWSRLQINVQVSVVDAVPTLGKLKDQMILPLVWFEMGVDQIPESVLSTLKQAYFTVRTVEGVLQWGSLLCAISSLCAMAFMIKKHWEIELPKWQNNISLKPGC